MTRDEKRRTSPGLGEQLNSLGEFIGARRKEAALTLRQLAEQAGVSNPYLSQIERGLRKPSAEVLQQLAKALEVSAESLYIRAGILDPESHTRSTVAEAVQADPLLSDRQRRALMEVYASFTDQAKNEPDTTSRRMA